MSAESDADKIAVVTAWVEAYNALDNVAMRSIIGEDAPIRHHNRGVDLKGAQDMMDILEQFEGITEGKRFHPPTRQLVSGDYVITEHVWEATFKEEVPGFATAGETVQLDLLSIWEIRDGKIVEYDDWG